MTSQKTAAKETRFHIDSNFSLNKQRNQALTLFFAVSICTVTFKSIQIKIRTSVRYSVQSPLFSCDSCISGKSSGLFPFAIKAFKENSLRDHEHLNFSQLPVCIRQKSLYHQIKFFTPEFRAFCHRKGREIVISCNS